MSEPMKTWKDYESLLKQMSKGSLIRFVVEILKANHYDVESAYETLDAMLKLDEQD